jgi:hypothetical protein
MLHAQDQAFEKNVNVEGYFAGSLDKGNIVLPSELQHILAIRKISSQAEFYYRDSSVLDSGATDSLPPSPKRKLLPDNMSFMERGLWGETGLFRKMGIASPLTPEVRKSELGLRRTMLTMHQIGGFVTLGLMGTAVFYGQKIIDGRDDLRGMHQTFVTATIISYSATGLLSILSPPPLIRRDEFSTTTLHKTLAWVHFAGMVVTPILGSMIGRHADYSQRARIHQVSAYITMTTLAASLIIITF